MGIRIGSSVNEYLILDVLGRKYPSMTDSSTINWLDVNASICVKGFTGQIREELYTYELSNFKVEIEKLFQSLTGKAELFSMEKWIYLKFEGDGKGHILCEGRVTDGYYPGNVLTFFINLDQTFLPDIINSLKEVLFSYPVVRYDQKGQEKNKESLLRKLLH